MLRRDVIKGMLAIGAGSQIPFVSAGQKGTSLVNSGRSKTAKKQFNKALAHEPGLIAFKNVEQNFSRNELKVEGQIPLDLEGLFYRNGPAKHERRELRYRHLFEGDGMIQKFEIKHGRVFHTGKFIETPKYVEEEQAGEFLYQGPETKFAAPKGVGNSDTINVANINLLPVGSDLWALWEAGSASHIEPESLEYKGWVNLGKDSQYGDSLKGLPFSAHPKVEPNGDIWNFGLGPSGRVLVYHLSPAGKMKKVKMLDLGYKGNMLHDFLITQNHVLIILPSLTTTRRPEEHSKGLFSSTQFEPDTPMRVAVIRKLDFSIVKQYELSPGFVFHFGNAWEDKSGVIRFDASLYPNVDVLHDLSHMTVGDLNKGHTNSKMALFELHPNGKAKQQIFDIYSEFPKVMSDRQGLKAEKVYHLSSAENKLFNDTVCSFDCDNGKEDRFVFGEEFLVEEHLPIKTKTGNYLIGTALHIPTKRSCVNVFEANNISSGPVARAWLPYHIPFGFHGCFVQS